ncbi:MAG: M42 family metallopeptidase [Bacillota bacterium]
MKKINSMKLIEDLSNASGISGFEDEVLEVIKNYLSSDFTIKEDQNRNLYIYRKDHDPDKPVVMLDGHSDEIGFMVQSIKPNGTIKFLTIGSWFSQNVPAHKVRIKNSEGNYIKGIVASKPPHFMTEDEKNEVIKFKDMVIDIGASSKEEVTQDYKIEIGAPIIPDVKFEYHDQKDIMLGKAFDNRLGCSCVIELMESFKQENLEINLVGSITGQEEIGTRGAEITAREISPDVAMVFEGTPADDTFKEEYEIQSALNKGPQIRHRDVSIITHPRFNQFARKIAKNNNIAFQDAVRSGGGNNGGKIALSNGGVPTIVLGVPVRYAHTHYGISSFLDYKALIKWSQKIIKNLNQNIISNF